MEEILYIELTTVRRMGFGEDGNKVFVCLPFDHAEQRDGYSFVLTRGGGSLYVAESLEEIKELLTARAEYQSGNQ